MASARRGHLRYAAYEATGGVRGAVARLAEDAYGRLDPAQRDVARKLLVRLAADAPGGAVVRRRLSVSQLGGDAAPVLSALTERRLLTVRDTTAAGHRARRRLRAALAAMAALVVLAAATGIVALRQRDSARTQARTAVARRLDAQALAEDSLDRSLLLARQAVDVQDSADTRSALFSVLLRAPAAIAAMRIGQQLSAMDLRPDGRALAIADWTGAVHFVDPLTRRTLPSPFQTGQAGSVDVVRFSPDGARLAVMAGGYLHLLDARTFKLVVATVLPDRTVSEPPAEFSSDSKVVAAPVAYPDGTITGISPSPDGRLSAVTYDESTVRLWDLASRRPLGPSLPGPRNVRKAVFVDRGTHVATISSDGRGYVWDVRRGAWMRRACDVAGRTLTRAEWREALPGSAYAPACRR